MYLSEENFTCPIEQIMLKQLSLAPRVLIPNVNFFENSMKPDINLLKAVLIHISWLLKKPADQDPHCFPNNMQV